jgi:hypothetical protein
MYKAKQQVNKKILNKAPDCSIFRNSDKQNARNRTPAIWVEIGFKQFLTPGMNNINEKITGWLPCSEMAGERIYRRV